MNADELRRSEAARLERLLERVTPIENTRLQYIELNRKCAEAQQYPRKLSLLKNLVLIAILFPTCMSIWQMITTPISDRLHGNASVFWCATGAAAMLVGLYVFRFRSRARRRAQWQQYIADLQLNDIPKCSNTLNGFFQTYEAVYGEPLSLPRERCYPAEISQVLRVLYEHRADNIKEAINILWSNHQHVELMNMQQRATAAAERAASEAENLKYYM